MSLSAKWAHTVCFTHPVAHQQMLAPHFLLDSVRTLGQGVQGSRMVVLPGRASLKLQWGSQAVGGGGGERREVGRSLAVSPSVRPCACPPLPSQVHGSRLRLPQVTPADSGEYVCRVGGSSGTQEASVLVTIQKRLGPTLCGYLRGHRRWCAAMRAISSSAAPIPCLASPSPSPECGVPRPH